MATRRKVTTKTAAKPKAPTVAVMKAAAKVLLDRYSQAVRDGDIDLCSSGRDEMVRFAKAFQLEIATPITITDARLTVPEDLREFDCDIALIDKKTGKVIAKSPMSEASWEEDN